MLLNYFVEFMLRNKRRILKVFMCSNYCLLIINLQLWETTKRICSKLDKCKDTMKIVIEIMCRHQWFNCESFIYYSYSQICQNETKRTRQPSHLEKIQVKYCIYIIVYVKLLIYLCTKEYLNHKLIYPLFRYQKQKVILRFFLFEIFKQIPKKDLKPL